MLCSETLFQKTIMMMRMMTMMINSVERMTKSNGFLIESVPQSQEYLDSCSVYLSGGNPLPP